MKKYRKQIYRITSLLCSIVLIVSLAVLPASASSFETPETMFNYFNYSGANAYHTVYPNSNTVSFPLSQRQYIRYVDLVIATGQTLNGVSCTRGSNTTNLTLTPIGNGYYRVYGALSGGKAAWDDQITFNFSVTSTGADIQFLEFRYSNMAIDFWRDTAGLYLQPSNVTGIQYMPDYNTPVGIDFTKSNVNAEYYGWIYLTNWRKYDYMDILVKSDSAGLASLFCEFDGKAVPFSVTLYDSAFNQIDHVEWDYDNITQDIVYNFTYGYYYQWLMIHVDLTNVRRTLSGDLTIGFTGEVPINLTGGIQVDSVRGYVVMDNQNQLAVLFSDLKTYLADLFGKDDPGAVQAAQSQEQLNVEINNQVSAAVSDWDVHIVEVQDGYDSGFEGAVPALSWLSSLAEGIFGNMGWFGSIYLLVGLISVYVLFLNKGGLIGRKLK